jgi:tetratricopeptide (TPR) repeat protein
VVNGADFVSLSPRDGEKTNGRISMQTAASSNLVLTDLSSFKQLAGLQKDISHAEFYQQILSGLIRGVYRNQIFTQLGNRLVALADHAYGLGQMRAVEEGSQLLVNLPLGREYESIGRYYQALCIYRRGRFAEARVLLEKVAGELPLPFRAKALLAISGTYYQCDDLQSFLLLNVEASRTAARNDWRAPQTFVKSQRNLAVLKSIDGDHRGALSVLEMLFPLARALGRWQPYLYYEHLNSLSVELMEAGRLEEARNGSRIALASPFAPAYPEWRETSEEIELRGWRPSRSVVAFHRATADAALSRRTADVSLRQITGGSAAIPAASEGGDVVRLPVTERHDTPVGRSGPTQAAAVVNIQEWKNKVTERTKTPKDREAKLRELQRLPIGDLIPMIWGRIADDDVDDDLLREVLLLLGDAEPQENQDS